MSFVKIIRRPAAQFESGLILDDDQIGFETDTKKFKIGDNVTTWANLLYADPTAVIAALALKADAAKFLTSYLATTVTYNANAVLANTPLSVTVAAGGIYAIELVVHSTSAVVGLRVDFGGTATIANFIGAWVKIGDEDPGSNFAQGNVSSAGADIDFFDGVPTYATFTGSIEITDAGTFLLRGSQNVSDASDTTILRGSVLKLTKMN